MGAVQRAYIYLACLASLESVAWAIVSLLRSLIAPGTYTSLETTAFEIAVVVVGLPIFLVHWLWAQRLARREREEREAVLRRLYLYGAMATFLAPFLANAFELIDSLIRAVSSGVAGPTPSGLSQAGQIGHNLAAMAVMAVLWAYHRHVAAADAAQIPEEGGAATVRRIYVYAFSAAGLLLTVVAVANLSRWLLFQVGGGTTIGGGGVGLPAELARLAVGLPTWLIFWTWAQRAFARPDEQERASAVRKLYLYFTLFVSVLATVITLAVVLADLFERLFGTAQAGSGDLREALPILLVAVPVWAYHTHVLNQDAALAATARDHTWIPQLYGYLVAAIGLGTLLVGLGGEASFLIRTLAGARFVQGAAGEAATFSALVVVGLPVWLMPWRRLQRAATAPGPAGDRAARSFVRKVYLYAYLFVATATVLGTGVYLVARLIGLALGVSQRGNLLADLGQAIAYSLLAAGLWLYHGAVLRADGRRLAALEARRLASFRVVVVDAGDGSLGRALLDELARELPGLDLHCLALSPEAAAALGACADAADAPGALGEADLIAGAWTMAALTSPGTAEVARAVAASPAPKLLLPAPQEGWHWLGASDPDPRDAVRQVVRAAKQAAAGQEIDVGRRLSAGTVVAIVAGVVVLLLGLGIPLVALLAIQGLG